MAISYLEEVKQAQDAAPPGDHRSLRMQIYSTSIAIIVLVSSFSFLRLYSRGILSKALGIDDYCMFVAAFCTICLCVLTIYAVYHGLGSHVWDIYDRLDEDDARFGLASMRITQALYGCYLAYSTAITLTKSSIVSSYLRIFPNRIFRQMCFFTGAVVVAMWLAMLGSIIFQCIPVRHAWEWAIPGKCLNVQVFFYISSGINLVTDLVILILPLRIIWASQMKRREKVQILTVFGFGTIACFASAYRITKLNGLHTKDITYTAVPALMWSIIEITVAQICASAPALRRLLEPVLPKKWVSNDIPAPVLRPSTHRRRPSIYQMSTYGPYLGHNDRNSMFSNGGPGISMGNYNSLDEANNGAGGHDSSTSITRVAHDMGVNGSSLSITRPEPVANPNDSALSFARSDQIVGVDEKV